MPVNIPVEELASAMNMTVLEAGRGSMHFTTGEISRPGLQFTGYYEHFAPERLQLVGNAEMDYLHSMSPEALEAGMRRFMGTGVPCMVCARGKQPPDGLLACAGELGIPVFRSDRVTGTIGHMLQTYLERKLAPKIFLHGVLLDVFGVGVLLTGDSGLGKSETALELIKGGHRLCADDVVEITRVSPERVVGCAPELTRHLIEVRGVGIVDVRYLFGVGAVVMEKTVDMIIRLELWDESHTYERVSTGEQSTKLIDVDVPTTVVPVSPGRNVAVVVEVAARNFRLKNLGYDAAGDFAGRWKSIN